MKIFLWAIIKTEVVRRKLAMDNVRDEKKKLFNRMYYSLNNEFKLNKMERIQVLRELYTHTRKEIEQEALSASQKYSELEIINDEIKQVI